MDISTPCPVHKDVAFRYHLKNRFNPNYASVRVLELRARRRFLIGKIVLYLLACSIGELCIWYISNDGSLGEHGRPTSMIATFILFSTFCVRPIQRLVNERSEERKLSYEIQVFEERYLAFLETVGLTPGNIDPLSDKKIEKLCEQILGTQAKTVAVKNPRMKKVREKRLVDVYEAVTRIGYGKKDLQDYVKRATPKARTKKTSNRRAKA